MELDSEPSELNYEGGEEPIYDSHQREKSTGSGLVLAVPAMVLDPEDTETQGIRVEHRGGGVVVSGGEYENLVADNQYYEQVEFGKLAAGRLGRQASHVMEDSLYSIPQVVSSNNSTTGLTTNLVKGMSLSALSQRLTSIRQTFSRRRREREQEAQQQKSRNIISSAQLKSVEDMYSKPNKFSLPVIPDTANPSLVIVTKKTMNMVRRQAEDDDRSYMSVHVQSAGQKESATRKGKEMKSQCCSYCDSQKLKKYSVMFLLVSSLVTMLTVGLYFMSDNVVTVSNKGLSNVNRRSFVYDSLDSRVNRATTWKDYNQINWGTAPVRPLTTPSSSFPSLRDRSRSSASSSPSSASATWSRWSSWSECSRNPCIKGETIARSRRCATLSGEDADMKICLGKGGVNVEMEPCFCF